MALKKGTREGGPFTTDGKREQLLTVQHPPLDLSLHDGHIVTLLLGQSTLNSFYLVYPHPFFCCKCLIRMYDKSNTSLFRICIFKEGSNNSMAQSHTCGMSHIGSISFFEHHRCSSFKSHIVTTISSYSVEHLLPLLPFEKNMVCSLLSHTNKTN